MATIRDGTLRRTTVALGVGTALGSTRVRRERSGEPWPDRLRRAGQSGLRAHFSRSPTQSGRGLRRLRVRFARGRVRPRRHEWRGAARRSRTSAAARPQGRRRRHIGTPDHWHAMPFIAACMAGKDVYVEKPVAHNILEGRAMVNAARSTTGSARSAPSSARASTSSEAVKLVQEGKLGRVSMTRTWNFSNETPAGIGKPADAARRRPTASTTTCWLGPAPKAPLQPRPLPPTTSAGSSTTPAAR